MRPPLPHPRRVLRPLSLFFLLLSLLSSLPLIVSASVYATWISPASASIPSPRCDPILTPVISSTSNSLFLFGGTSPSSGPLSDQYVASFTAAGVVFNAISTRSSPSERFGGDGAVVVEQIQQPNVIAPGGGPVFISAPVVYVYGGEDAQGRYLDDIWRFVPSISEWTQIRPTSFSVALPPPNVTLQSTQPSARMYTRWEAIAVSMGGSSQAPIIPPHPQPRGVAEYDEC